MRASAQPSRPSRPPAAVCSRLICLLGLLVSACTHQPLAPDFSNPVAIAAAQAALLPTRLIIHPLTRIGPDPKGEPALLAHIELRDQYDLHTRALGVLRISVQKPGHDTIMAAADPSAIAPGDQSWEIDLRDPEKNATMYDDLVTRTYSVTLASPPQWLLDWNTGRDKTAAGTGAPTIIASFIFPDPRTSGGQKSLTDTARLLR